MASKPKTEEIAGSPASIQAGPALTGPGTARAQSAQRTAIAGVISGNQAQLKNGMEKAMKTAEEFVAFGQGNLEALVKSSQIWAAGLQDLSKQVAATAQSQFEDTMTAFKAITGARSVKDAFDVQAGFARSAIEKTISETGKLTETSVKLTEQALAPITARVALAVEKFARPTV